MAPRSRVPDTNPSQGESTNTFRAAAESQETTRSDEPIMTPPDFVELDEEQLDERIRLARAGVRLQRKRTYLAALERGEEPTINPYDFNEPAGPALSVSTEPPHRRPRREGARIQLAPLKYGGGNYADLKNYLFELDSRFVAYADDFQLDTERVMYALGPLPKSIKSRFRTHVATQYHDDLTAVTWSDMKEWLEQDVTDNSTRTFNAVKQLYRFRQREGQTFNQFLDAYEAIVNELSCELPAILQVCTMLAALRPELQRQITSAGVPADRQALISAARRAEALIPGGQPLGPSNQTPANSQRPPATGSPMPAVSPATVIPPQPQRNNQPAGQLPPPANQQRGSCFKCGDPGHYADRCPLAICGRCGRSGHTEPRCPEPVSAANRVPVARHAAPNP